MRGTAALVMSALVGVSLAACAQDPEPLPPSTGGGGSSSSTAAPSGSGSSSTVSDPELAAAIQRAQTLQDTRRAIVMNPKRSIDDISLVARGDASGQIKRAMQQFRAEGFKASGQIEVRDVTAKHLKDGERPRAQVRMCFDSSDYVIKDARGKEIKFSSATSIETRTLEQWGDTWYVTKVGSRDADC